MPRALLAALFLGAFACAGASGPRPQVGPTAPLQAPGDSLPAGAERAYTALAARFDSSIAISTVDFMQQYWRVAANPGFNASIDHIHGRLRDLAPHVQVRADDYKAAFPGWDYEIGSVWVNEDADPVLSRERDRVSLAINSFPTPPGGLRARLVDVRNATAADFEGRAIKGAVVLGDAPLGVLWQEAVRNRGAAGVMSTEIAAYIRPSDPARLSREQQDVLQWGSVPYDPALKAFGFKASWRAAQRLRDALDRDPNTQVRVQVASTFYPGPVRSLIAEIPGRSRTDERIVLVAHVQEPGANDNASGCATLVSIVRALAGAIRDSALPQPERTLTFMWVDEIRGSRQWIASRPEELRGVQYMFSMDMTGEDTNKTGGTFLIEKQADPTAVWDRPSDPHSEWGAGEVKPETLQGSLLNDVHLAVARRRSRDTGWTVRTNPYEGGSDHTVFASAGVPSLLNWHFTDRYYHTNQDTTDKVSAREMEHVGVTVGTSAYFLASASQDDALAVVGLLEGSAAARLELERHQGEQLVAAAIDRGAAEKREAQVLDAWKQWYQQALESVSRLPAQGSTPDLTHRIAEAVRKLAR